jgi:hypothetical protein
VAWVAFRTRDHGFLGGVRYRVTAGDRCWLVPYWTRSTPGSHTLADQMVGSLTPAATAG